MQITQTTAEGLRREFRIVISAADIERDVDKRLVELGRQVRLPGFRPGKVPMTILKQRYRGAVMGEVLEHAVNDSSRQAISEHGIRPALRPKIELGAFGDGKDLEYTMALELLPEIQPLDASAISLERLTASPPEEEVDKALADLAATRKRFADLAEPRPAAAGDQVTIDFEGAVGGVKRPEMKGEDFELEIGSGRFVPGFEDQLVGRSAGEEATVEVTFPETYPGKDLAGKAAVFDVKVKAVKAPEPVAVDDQLAKDLGMEGLEALRAAVRRQAEERYRLASRGRIKRALLDHLAKDNSFEVPSGMVDIEFDTIWRQVEEALKQAREQEEAHHGEEGHLHDPDLDKPEEQLKEEYRAIAERRVRLGLILSEVGRANNIEVTQEELSRAVAVEARRFPGQERRVLDFFRSNPQNLESLRAPILEDKVVDFILELAHIQERPVPPEELLRDPDEEPAAAEPEPAKPKARRKKAAAKAEDEQT
jgi:trigger factor